MNKEQQIEEMAVIGCVRNPQAHTAEECAKCDFKQGMCNAYRHAEALYNAGYGNVSEYRAERELLGSQIKVLKQRLNDKYIEVDNLNRDYHNSFERLKAQEREIMQLKADYAKLQEQFAQYQMASDKEIVAQVKQAVIEFAEKLKGKLQDFGDGGEKGAYITEKDIDEFIKEVGGTNNDH